MRDFHPAFASYIQAMIDERRASDDPPDDLITRFLRTDVDGEYLSDRAIVTQTMFILVAGNETTRNLISNCLHTLATTPEFYARVREDTRVIPCARRGVTPPRQPRAGARACGARRHGDLGVPDAGG
jgi:cytochrome P450